MPSNLTFTVSAVQVVPSSETTLKYAALNREATQAKAAGDLDGAISLLYQAKKIRGNLYQDTRLAKFLQQAGRLEEALSEIQWLIDHCGDCIEAESGPQPQSVSRFLQAAHIIRIHENAALICKRAKRSDLQAKHEAECEHWCDVHEQLSIQVEADKKRRAQEWKAAKANGIAAMGTFHKKWNPGT